MENGSSGKGKVLIGEAGLPDVFCCGLQFGWNGITRKELS